VCFSKPEGESEVWEMKTGDTKVAVNNENATPPTGRLIYHKYLIR